MGPLSKGALGVGVVEDFLTSHMSCGNALHSTHRISQYRWPVCVCVWKFSHYWNEGALCIRSVYPELREYYFYSKYFGEYTVVDRPKLIFF